MAVSAESLLGSTAASPIARTEVERWVGTYGTSISTGLFDPDVRIFRVSGIEGGIGYRLAWGCAVPLGDPVCPEANRRVLVDAFREECRSRGLNIVYTVASDAFADWARAHGMATVEFGHEHVLDPTHDVLAGSSQQRLRGKVHRAEREGVAVREYARDSRPNPRIENAMLGALEAWRSARRGPQIYLNDVRLFAAPAWRRWFVAWQGDVAVGVALLTRLERLGGYVVNQLFQRPEAPPGTTELLAVRAVQTLGGERCRHVTFGAVPGTELGRIEGLSPSAARFARVVFRRAAQTFHLEEREMYRHKFPVAEAPPVHLLFDPPRLGLRQALALMRAFNASLHA